MLRLITFVYLVTIIATLAENEVSQDNTFVYQNNIKKTKIKRTKCPVNYYSNYDATLNLILSGDIELNPGPGLHARKSTPKCLLCNKGVGTNRKRLQCSQCQNLTHVTCLNISKTAEMLHRKNRSILDM